MIGGNILLLLDRLGRFLPKWVNSVNVIAISTLAQKISKYCPSTGHVLTCKCQINLSIATLVNAFTLPDTYGEVHWWDLHYWSCCYTCCLRNYGWKWGFEKEDWAASGMDIIILEVGKSHMMISHWLVIGPLNACHGALECHFWVILRCWGSSLDLGLKEPVL